MPRNWAWGKKRKSGFRSGLEETVAKALDDKGIKWTYETLVLNYKKTVRRGKCDACGSTKVVQIKTYTPDFILENGMVLEIKGRLTQTDRTKLLAVRESNPTVRFGLYFASDNKLSKNNETRYSDWASKHKWDFSIGAIPRRWLNKRGEKMP